jgi:tripartite-type tricarboxylate transporter receptor subunit TctC
MKRSTFVAASLAAMLLPIASFAQSDWPNRPITFIVPYPPGGLNDAVARVFADRMTSELGRQVLVDNKAGAATTVASNFVAKARPMATRSTAAARRW